MFQKPVKTYGKKTQPVTSSFGPELMKLYTKRTFVPITPDSSIDFDEYLSKSANDSNDRNPFESTFDRVVRSAKLPATVDTNLQLVDSTTDSSEEPLELIPIDTEVEKNVSRRNSRSNSDDFRNENPAETEATKHGTKKTSDVNKSQPSHSLVDSESIESIVLNGPETQNSSIDSDDNFQKPAGNKSGDQSPLEYSSESTKLPATSPHDLNPQFVDTTTDSNEESFEFIPIDNPEVQININDRRKYKSSNLVDNKKEDKAAKSLQAKTRVRKRQIKNIGKDSSDSDASAKSSPVRKTRRAVNKIYNRVSRDRAGSPEDKNKIVCKKVTGVNELKDCCVKLTRLELKENRFNNNYDDEFNSVNSDDCRGDDANDVEGDGDVDSDMKTKECRVRLSRLNNNSKLGLQADLMQTFLSSTPCDHRVGFKKLKPTVSPIQLPGSDKKNLTVPPTILLNDSNELFGDEDGRSPARKSSKKLSESSESVVEDTFSEQKKPAVKVKLRLNTEEEASIKSVDLFSSYSDELSNKSGDNDPSVVNSTDDNVFEGKEFNEDNGTTRSSSRTLIDPTLSVGQTSADPDVESVEINQNSGIDSSQLYEMDQRSSIDDSVLLEIDEGNMVDNSKSFGITRRMSSADTNSEVYQNKNSQLIQMDKKNLTADSEASEISHKFIGNSKLLEMDQRSSIADSEPSEISHDKFIGNSKLLEMDQRSSIADSESSEISQDKFIEDSKSSKMDQPSSLIDENLINQSASVNNTSSVMIINENSSLIENSMSITEDTADKNDLNDSSETDDDYHLVVSNTSSNKEDDNSPEVSSQEDDDKKDEEEAECSESKNVSIIKPSEPIVLLERINSLGHITKRRREYQSWARDLGDIAESSGLGLSHVAEETEKIPEHVNQRISRRRNVRSTKTALPVRRSSRIKSDPSELDDRPKKSRVGFLEPISDPFDEDDKNDDAKVLYLKPGKSWARSLSILNNIRKEEDLDSMSTGNKGKKWRQSVRNVLSMQRQSVVQSCVKDKENDKSERQTFSDRLLASKRSNAPKVSIVNNNEAVESGAGRFFRRMSIRVVPNSNKYSIVNDKIIEDSSFLKVFGISTDKNDEVQKKSLAAKDSLVYQLRCSSTPALDVLPEPVSARNVVLQRCDQTDSLPFETCYPDSYLKYCRKIGEGVYGEVFLYDNKKDKSVIKIIPIEGSELVNGEPQKKYGEILSEIIIAKELHNLRFNKIYQTNGFVEVKNIRCIVGKYPHKLLELWDTYDEEKNSENDSPSMFTDDQIYIALELGNGGQDMEAFVFNNSAEAYITFLQAALALAVAEKSLDFEHRDMHWGNILISRTNEKQVSCRLGNEEISLQCNGIKTTIIDFTLSRMSYQGCCMFNDLSLDPALFTAVGEYQFDIYRLMKEKTENNWQSFVPYTNILWLHYTLDKMVTAVRYKNVTSKIHKQSIQKLEELKSTILEYESAFDFISNCDKLTSLRRSIC